MVDPIVDDIADLTYMAHYPDEVGHIYDTRNPYDQAYAQALASGRLHNVDGPTATIKRMPR